MLLLDSDEVETVQCCAKCDLEFLERGAKVGDDFCLVGVMLPCVTKQRFVPKFLFIVILFVFSEL